MYIAINSKSASEHNIRPNKKVYTELYYYMENSILVAMATTLDDERNVATHRLHSLYLCTKYET